MPQETLVKTDIHFIVCLLFPIGWQLCIKSAIICVQVLLVQRVSRVKQELQEQKVHFKLFS